MAGEVEQEGDCEYEQHSHYCDKRKERRWGPVGECLDSGGDERHSTHKIYFGPSFLLKFPGSRQWYSFYRLKSRGAFILTDCHELKKKKTNISK
jgi:hypothetical protein